MQESQNNNVLLTLSYVTCISKLVELCEFVKKSYKGSLKSVNERCDLLINEYKNWNNKQITNEDVVLVKKIFSVMRDNIKELKTKDSAIFWKKNDQNQIITIVRKLDLGSVYNTLHEEEQFMLWMYLYALFVTSVRLINVISPNKIDNVLNKVCNQFVEELTIAGMDHGDGINAVLGVGEDINNCSVDELIESCKKMSENDSSSSIGFSLPTDSISALLKNLKISEHIDFSHLTRELGNITDEKIEESVLHITSILGTDNVDVSNTLSSIMKSVMTNLKTSDLSGMDGSNGFESLIGSLGPIINELKDKISLEDVQKVGSALGNMNLDKNELMSKLGEMRDANGNKIVNDALSKQLLGSVDMLRNVLNNPAFANIANLINPQAAPLFEIPE